MPIDPEIIWPNLSTKYQWQTHGEYDCPFCASLRGRIYTQDIWFSVSLVPGFHLGCDCTLRKVPDDFDMSDLDFFGGADLALLLDDLQLTGRLFSFWPFRSYQPLFRFNRNWRPQSWSLAASLEEAHAKLGPSASMYDVIKYWNQGSGEKFPSKPWQNFFYAWRTINSLNAQSTIDDLIEGIDSFTHPIFWALDPLFPTDGYTWDATLAGGTVLSDFTPKPGNPLPDNIRQFPLYSQFTFRIDVDMPMTTDPLFGVEE